MSLTLIPAGSGPFHFIGLGGIGMSGIAEILLAEGFEVQGSDLKASPILERLAAKGAKVFIGQEAANVAGAGVVVVSTAIRASNPELAAARAAGLPVIHRSQMLAELMKKRLTVCVAGTHGKTTTTTMVAAMLDQGGIDPTVVNGGVIHAYGSNARAGRGEWMVVEADESDGSFNRLPTTIGIITNIDPEHLEHWGDFEDLKAGFRRFAESVPFYGRVVLCTDHPLVAELAGQITDRPVTTFGFNEGADLRAEGLRFEKGKAHFRVRVKSGADDRTIDDLTLPMPGDHNVSNALSAIAVALHLGMPDNEIRAALDGFSGVGRRFTKVGEAGGITVIDDYGHHPVEIKAVIKAARQALGGAGKVIAVHQPHRYSRLSALFADFACCFEGADAVGLLPVYSAGEDPIAGATSEALIAAMASAEGSVPARLLESEADLLAMVRELAGPGDMVVCLGAGTISAWAQALPARLAAQS